MGVGLFHDLDDLLLVILDEGQHRYQGDAGLDAPIGQGAQGAYKPWGSITNRP